MTKIDDSFQRWICALFFGVVLTPLNSFGVWVARRNALDVNGIVLTPYWYLFALAGPLLSIGAALLIHRSHRIWQGDLLLYVLFALILASFAHIPLMYSAGGFR
jgi:hypothetical protein